MTTTPSGLQYEDTVAGSGAYCVSYEGFRKNGTL